MNGTLFSLNLLDTPIGWAMALLIGVLFGFFLEQAGFGSSRKLTGIFYFKDMAVLKVMFTAVVTTLVGYPYLVALGWLAPADLYLLDTFWKPQIVGGLLFGVGFVMGGWCPGTAFVGLSAGKLDALVFLGGAILGGIVFNEVYPVFQPMMENSAGTLFLADTLGLSTPMLVVLFCVVAVLAFAGSTWIERKAGATVDSPKSVRRHRGAAALLILLALGTFALPPPPDPDTSVADWPMASLLPADLLAAIDRAEDHWDPLDLAEALMRGEPGVTLIDLRPLADYNAYHLPGALHLPLERLAAEAAVLIPRTGRVVLISNGTAHAAQAWVTLRMAGWSDIYVLTDGMLGFWRQVLTPPSLQPGADPQRAASERDAYFARRAFFLAGDSHTPVGSSTPEAYQPEASPTLDAPAPAAGAAGAELSEPGLDRHVVSTDWLAERMHDPTLRIVDVRPNSTDYTRGHIPGAVYLGMHGLRGTVNGIPSMLLPANELALALGRAGILRDHTVLLYSNTIRDATMAAMAFHRVGHERFAVLNGGFDRWIEEQRPVSKVFSSVDTVVYTPVEGADTFTVDVNGMAEIVVARSAVIVDVRPADYFSGAKSDETRPGHIPGALNREFTLDLVPGKESWRSLEQLRAVYADLGIEDPDTPIVVHCRTGHQGSQTYFTLRHLLGFRNVRWFDASWSGWAARPDLPAATGQP